jgi:hypothetical protein
MNFKKNDESLFFSAAASHDRCPLQKKQRRLAAPRSSMAEWTGLEPATPGVTGRYSNQLNYHSALSLKPGVEFRTGFRADDRLEWCTRIELVGAEGFEPPTLAL